MQFARFGSYLSCIIIDHKKSSLCLISFLFAFVAFTLIGCGEGGSSGEGGGGYPVCSKLQPSSGGVGGPETYETFPTFDSGGIQLSHTIGTISYTSVTDDELKSLRQKISGYTNYFGMNSYYEKCNVEPGMHAKVIIGDETDEYRLELSLYGNGSFVPNAAKFEETFVEIDSSVGFFYVWRNYNANIRDKLDSYMEAAELSSYSCNSASCHNGIRWFNTYGDKSIDWHVDYL
ncbi:MAG: hypothetical protein LBI57_03905 [Helicobacteraceae bacterium]|jgi:hypothetical protein|nr:hypothetical protein [Helicobacteraceae bacterium]